ALSTGVSQLHGMQKMGSWCRGMPRHQLTNHDPIEFPDLALHNLFRRLLLVRRRPGPDDGLTHHSDRGVQYLAMNYTQRLADAKLVPSVGNVGDSYDNALAETINGLSKAEVIWRQRSWPSASAVEMATLNWVEWFNYHRLFGPIGYIPPAEAEANYYATLETLDMVA
uniref:integrase core domain-containing protein n=1 Tax=Sphingomonas populi TaxID=2484750 RepID=UPI001E626D6B